MQITRAELLYLLIPLRLSISHGARADRAFSDSIIVRVTGATGAVGYGEAVVREYVSGLLEGESGFRREAASLVGRMLAPLKDREHTWEETKALLSGLECDARSLPFLCAVETALLDLGCAEAGKDVYAFIGTQPLRERVTYGGVIPIVPLPQAESYLQRYLSFRFSQAKVKVGDDPAYNDAMLGLCRRTLGDGFDIRVDANASWPVEAAREHLDICVRHGVFMIEQPFPVAAAGAEAALVWARARGFQFIADEEALTESDVASLAAGGGYGALNLRLSKNGGLSRVLSLARAAEANGMRYQLGCMVGETGILSALGRVAASLLPAPLYVEGSYDDIQLSENVTTRSFGFGPGGVAPIVKGSRIGYTVSEEKLGRLAAARMPCP